MLLTDRTTASRRTAIRSTRAICFGTRRRHYAGGELEERATQLEELADINESLRIQRLDAETGLQLARQRQREQEKATQQARFVLQQAEQRTAELQRRQHDLQQRLQMRTRPSTTAYQRVGTF